MIYTETENIDSCIDITVMMSMANRTLPLTDRQILGLLVYVPTDVAGLRGWEVSVYLHDLLAIPLSLVGEHGDEITPARIGDGLRKTVVSLHSFDVQVLNTDGVVSPYKGYGTLMQVVGTAVGYLLVNPGDFELLVFKPSAAFLLSGQMLLCLCKFALVSLGVSVVLENFSIRSNEQVLQAHINAHCLARLLDGRNVFLLREHGNEILAARCLGNSSLADLARYLTVNTAFDTLLELVEEEPAASDGDVLRYGKAILGVLRLETWELCPLLKEVGIGCIEGAEGELQRLSIYFFEPCGSFLLLQLGKRLCLSIVVVALASKPVLFFTLIEEMIIHKTGAAEVPCQQLGLFHVRVQPELVCPVNLPHISFIQFLWCVSPVFCKGNKILLIEQMF